MRSNRSRVAGSVVLALAGAAGLLATTFRVSFPTDPLGPRVFPLFAVAMLAVGALSLFRSNEAPAEWPEAPAARRIGLAVISFVAYALLLGPFGFVISTAAVFTALALLFGGRGVQSGVAGLTTALLLYAVFVYGLGLPLPLGALLESLVS